MVSTRHTVSAWRIVSAWRTVSAWRIVSAGTTGCCGRRLRRAIPFHVVDCLVVELVRSGSGRAITPVVVLPVRRFLRPLARVVIALRLPAVARDARL